MLSLFDDRSGFTGWNGFTMASLAFPGCDGNESAANQKQVCQQEARRRLIAEGRDAATVAFQVGYALRSKFSRGDPGRLVSLRGGTQRTWLISPGAKPISETKVRPTVADKTEIKILSDNRSAGHNYHLDDRYEAGLVLTGTEVKAAKSGKVQLKESYAEVSGSEAWLVNAHISEYSHGNQMNHPPVRKRKLLLHRKEIEKLQVETREKGLTIVPTKLYLKGGRIKIEIAVGKGKKFHDKREAAKTREMQDEAKAAMARQARQ